MPDVLLEITELTKAYGAVKALRDLSLQVHRGDIYGLVGPNGAGKTTCFRICATILRPTAGTVTIDGLPVASDHPRELRDVRRRIGYMPDSFGVYEDMSVEEYLDFFAAAYDIAAPKRRDLVADVLHLVDLEPRRQDLVETLSRGMQQRLGLARVLIHDPDLLILDEPASGLDPRARVEIRSLLLELRSMGKTIFISSHVLADLGEICNRIGILEEGRLKVDGTLQDVLGRAAPSPIVRLRLATGAEAAREFLADRPEVARVEAEGESLVLEVVDGFREYWRLNHALVEAGYQVALFEPETRNLEHAFLALTEDKLG